MGVVGGATRGPETGNSPKKTGAELHDLRFGRDFRPLTPKAHATKVQLDKLTTDTLDYTKL